MLITETPVFNIDWTTNEDINTLLRFLDTDGNVKTTSKTYRLIDFFMLNEEYLNLCYSMCSNKHKYRIISQYNKEDSDLILNERQVSSLIKDYDLKDVLKYTRKDFIFLVGSITLETIDSLDLSALNSIEGCYIVGDTVSWLVHSSRSPVNYIPTNMDIYSVSDDTTSQLLDMFNVSSTVLIFEYENVINVFIKDVPINIQITRISCDITDVLNSYELDCCKAYYCKGIVFATTAFHLCMLNNWTFDLSTASNTYILNKYRARGITITNTKDMNILEDTLPTTKSIPNAYMSRRNDYKKIALMS